MDRIKERLLSVISHRVRRYLGNIKGILNIIDDSEIKQNTFEEMKGALKESVESLEEAIRNMEDELKDKIET